MEEREKKKLVYARNVTNLRKEKEEIIYEKNGERRSTGQVAAS